MLTAPIISLFVLHKLLPSEMLLCLEILFQPSDCISTLTSTTQARVEALPMNTCRAFVENPARAKRRVWVVRA